VEVEIVGIFSGTNPKQATYQVELFENLFLTDLATTRQLNAYTAQNEIYQDATFFTKGTKQLDEVMARAHKLPVNWQKYQLNKNSQELAGVTGAVNGVYGPIDGMLWATALVSVAVIGMVLYLWMNERKREAGVLLATGVPQSKIVLQYIAELVMIAVLSFGVSYVTAGLIAQQLGDHVVSQAAQNATRQASSSLGGASLGADADSVTSSRTLEKVTVGVQPTDLLAVWGAGLAVIIIAVLLASRPITGSTPKELLTEVD
ncbi:ABC transporter permease, partial [Candidatus Saccharibacteria bacterium]|nr:ABC transporter permease [Candidatus Saccharibacteria bacterium]